MSTSQVHATLTVFGNLCDLLDRFAELVVAESSRRQQLQLIATLNKMWSSLAQNLISYVKEVNSILVHVYMCIYMYMYMYIACTTAMSFTCTCTCTCAIFRQAHIIYYVYVYAYACIYNVHV